MLVESLIGKFTVTALESDANSLSVSAEKRETIVSLLDTVELMGGAYGEDQSFAETDVEPFTFFGREHFRTTISRAQLLRYFESEILDYLTYSSLTQMRNISKGNYPK